MHLLKKQIDPTKEGLKRNAEVSRFNFVAITQDDVDRELFQIQYDIDAVNDAGDKIPGTNQKDFRTYDLDPANPVDAAFMTAYRTFILAKGEEYVFVDPMKQPQEVTDED